MTYLRKILLPFSLVYRTVVVFRNLLYDKGIIHTYKISEKSICVGNLSTGGTGKTPHVAYLAEYFRQRYEISILSRGYGRKTHGFRLVSPQSKAEDVGDEPLLYAKQFNKSVHVTVCEKRSEGVKEIQNLFPSNKLIILDDAFQHRAVKAGFSILLTQYNKPYFKDYMLPAGNLREPKSARKRADLIIVTKCPEEISIEEQISLKKQLNFPNELIFFSRIAYGNWIAFGKPIQTIKKILLITGIADPKPLQNQLKKDYELVAVKFKDHHHFSADEIQEIHQKFDTFADEQMIILTTEKDYMRLISLISQNGMDNYPWYYQPIMVQFENENKFKELIDSYVDTI